MFSTIMHIGLERYNWLDVNVSPFHLPNVTVRNSHLRALLIKLQFLFPSIVAC